MKICPFLVAGEESLQHRGAMSLRTPAETPRLEITRNEADKAPAAEQPMANEAAKPVATDLWTLEESSPPRSGLECLGEPCRFFHAGGCRFDVLFAAATEAGSASAAGTLLVQEGESDGVTMSSVLQEIWSLQRESLKEVIGGFRHFEGEQSRHQASLAGHIEQMAKRLEGAHGDSPEVVRRLDDSLATLQRAIPTLEKTQSDVAATRVAAEGVRNDVTVTLAAVEGACADIAATRVDIEGTRTAIDATRTGIEGTRAAIAEARADIDKTRAAIAETRSTIAEAREESRHTLQENLDATRRLLGESVESMRTKLEHLAAQNTSTSHAELEGRLQRLLEDSAGTQGLRAELQQALQTLASHVREVTAAASSLATSSSLATDLLVEQRAFTESLLQRERRDEARRLNNAGVLAYHEGAYDASVDKFRKAVALDPSLAAAWNNLGLSYTEMQADGEALEAFKKALGLDPNVGQVYNNLGYLYHRRGEVEEAVEMYQRATQRATDSSSAWSNLGNALHTLSRRDEAVSAWKRALELDPTNDKASGALERMGLGG